jgi:hypothetical protein
MEPWEEAEWAFWDAALEVRLIDGVADLLPVIEGFGLRMGVS